jgi:hemerythrin-like domain-containing protein
MGNRFVKKVVFLVIALPAILSGFAHAADQQEFSAQDPRAQLEKEHDITLKMLDAANQEAATIRQTGSLNAQRILDMLDFFSNFVDKCHHAKEERFYFPAAKFYDGRTIENLTAELVNEHNYGRTLLQELTYMLDQEKTPTPTLVADRLDRYAEMIRAHIGKENQILYQQADLRLPLAEKAGMMQGFARIEKQELGEGFHDKYHALAMEVLK